MFGERANGAKKLKTPKFVLFKGQTTFLFQHPGSRPPNRPRTGFKSKSPFQSFCIWKDFNSFLAMGWSGIEVYYTPGSPHCRAVLMCIKALDLEVELSKLDMYQKYEHKKPWFVKVRCDRISISWIKAIKHFSAFGTKFWHSQSECLKISVIWLHFFIGLVLRLYYISNISNFVQ